MTDRLLESRPTGEQAATGEIDPIDASRGEPRRTSRGEVRETNRA